MSGDPIAPSQSNLELKSLYEILLLPHQGDLQDYFFAVMAILSEYFQIRYSALFLKDHQKETLQMEALFGTKKDFHPFACNIQQGTMAEVLESGQPKVIKELDQEPIYEEMMKIQNLIGEIQPPLLCVPLIMDGDPYGVINMNSLYGAKDEFDEEFQYLTILSAILSPVINNYLLKREAPIKANPLRANLQPLDVILEEKLSEVLNRIDPYVETKANMTLFNDIIGIVERGLIKSALKRANYVQVAASQLLGINRNTLRKKIKELKIKVQRD